MNDERFEYIPLSSITPHPDNPRKQFDGPEFDELVASIKQKGVIVPVLLRPLPSRKKKDLPYQLVAGERRWRARQKAAEANGGPEKATIPAIIRELTDDEAFDIMYIENLQRKDLAPLEEAEGFKKYCDRKGEHAVAEISERTGIDARYIRRRLGIMALPDQVLKAWDKGELLYGHCEQLMRLKEKADVIEMCKRAVEHRLSVRDLAREITEKSPSLKDTVFDAQAAGCAACHQNSKIQKQLFDLGAEGKEARCLDPKCFKQHVNNHFNTNWKKTGWYKQHHTSGFRFGEDYPSWGGRNTRHTFRNYYSMKPPKSCHGCEHFVTLIKLDGSVDEGAVCIKHDQACFDTAVKSAAAEKARKQKAGQGKGNGGSQSPPDAPRVSWHGEHFRQEFFRQQIPLRLQEAPIIDDRVKRIQLFSLLHSVHDVHEWFEDAFIPEADRVEKGEYSYSFGVSDSHLWKQILSMDEETLDRALRETPLQVVIWGKASSGGPVYGGIDGSTRRTIAEYLGADIDREWTVTREYLDKKTTPEIHAWAQMYGIWETKEAQAYLYEALNKKRGKFASCKKAELVQLILNCGLDLRGKLPKEIRLAAEKENKRAEEDICDACRNRAYESADPEDEDDFGCKSDEDYLCLCCKTCTIEDCKARQVCRKPEATAAAPEASAPATAMCPDCNVPIARDMAECPNCHAVLPIDHKDKPWWKMEPCELCKSSHPDCDECCKECDHPCNASQACRIDASRRRAGKRGAGGAGGL